MEELGRLTQEAVWLYRVQLRSLAARIRQRELDIAIFIRLAGGIQVEGGEGNFPGLLFVEDPDGLPYDGVVLHFLPVPVFINQNGRLGRFNLGLPLRLRLRFMRGCRPFLVEPVQALLQLIEALLDLLLVIHLLGLIGLQLLLILIVGLIVIRSGKGIIPIPAQVIAVSPRIAPAEA